VLIEPPDDGECFLDVLRVRPEFLIKLVSAD
jgi:hypothetical protein